MKMAEHLTRLIIFQNVMIDGTYVFDQPINSIKHMKILEKLLQVKEMIIQQVAC